jgi:hypothetical protein
MSMDVLERLAVIEVQIKTLESRLAQYDEERAWLVKLVLGIIIAAVLGVVLSNGGV